MLDELLGDRQSADLLVAYKPGAPPRRDHSASGSVSKALVGRLQLYLQTWPALRPDYPVRGGLLIVNHQHRLDPDQRAPRVYQRREFVEALDVPVVPTRDLFDWWRESDWRAIRAVVLARADHEAGGDRPSTPSREPDADRSQFLHRLVRRDDRLT